MYFVTIYDLERRALIFLFRLALHALGRHHVAEWIDRHACLVEGW